jgi:hypothetical protein
MYDFRLLMFPTFPFPTELGESTDPFKVLTEPLKELENVSKLRGNGVLFLIPLVSWLSPSLNAAYWHLMPSTALNVTA